MYKEEEEKTNENKNPPFLITKPCLRKEDTSLKPFFYVNNSLHFLFLCFFLKLSEN